MIDDDCKDLLTGMLAYRARKRLSLDACLEHSWVKNRATLNEEELNATVKKKHKESRILRRKDKNKMKTLENSVKHRKKRRLGQCQRQNNSRDSELLRYQQINDFELPVSKNFIPTLLTFFAQKKYLNEAYDFAVNVFELAFKGKSQTRFSSRNPWHIKTLVKISNGESEQVFTVALFIHEIEGSDIVAFKFKRLQGDPIAFGRIWNSVEECLMKYSGSLFFDNVDTCFKTRPEIKEEEKVDM